VSVLWISSGIFLRYLSTGTSHVSAADRSGLAISLTTTVNLLFGSQVMVPETGIIMNNIMNGTAQLLIDRTPFCVPLIISYSDFSIPGVSNAFGYIPSPANYIRPGKRPLSSMTPMIVAYPDGELCFVVGGAGGSRIITATVESIIHILDGGLSTCGALAKPRLHDQLIPNKATFEYSYNNATVSFMKGRGHNISWASAESVVHAIRLLPNRTFEAAGEPRLKNSGGLAV
jgi:gamma-glutamyltranspeptidase / glutathione hydrolase